jgi:hypothetical protein
MGLRLSFREEKRESLTLLPKTIAKFAQFSLHQINKIKNIYILFGQHQFLDYNTNIKLILLFCDLLGYI